MKTSPKTTAAPASQKTSSKAASKTPKGIKEIIAKCDGGYVEDPFSAYLFGAGAHPSELVLLNDEVEDPKTFESGSVPFGQWNGKMAILFAQGDATYSDLPAAEALAEDLRKICARVEIVNEATTDQPAPPPAAADAKPQLRVVPDLESAAAPAPVAKPAPQAKQAAPAQVAEHVVPPSLPTARALPDPQALDEGARAALERLAAESLASLGLRSRAALLDFAARQGLIAEASAKQDKPPKGEGVIDVLARLAQRPSGVTREEAHAELVRIFPGRPADSMLNTVKVQLGGKGNKAGSRLAEDRKLSIKAQEEAGRGLVLRATPK